jgi:uncharacterized membrane protein (UPF0182 family)
VSPVSSSARTASSAPQLTRKLGVNGKTLVTAVNQDEQLRDLEGLFQSDDARDLPSESEIDSITSLGNLLFIVSELLKRLLLCVLGTTVAQRTIIS